jgi:hypothetical protein
MKIESICLRACLLAGVLAAGCGGAGTAPAAPAPTLSATSTSVNFGDVAVGTTTSFEVTFSNVSEMSISLQQTSVSGPGFTASGLGMGLTLPPGQYVALTVNFNPTTPGNAAGLVSLSSSSSTSPINISLAGDGIMATHSVALSWIASTSDDVVGYNIYRSPDPGDPSNATWVRLNSSPSSTTFYTDWDAQGGQNYLYTVTTLNATNVESTPSNIVMVEIPSQ